VKKTRGRLAYLIILGWAGFSQLYWRLNPQITSNHGWDLATVIFNVSRGLTMIGPDILILLLGASLARRVVDAKAQLVKIWLNTLFVGCLLSLIISLFSTSEMTTAFYDAALPILRNSYPLISGILLGLVLGRISDQLTRRWQAVIGGLSLAMITASTIFTPSIFGWREQTTSIFYALVFLLGWLESHQHLLNWGKRWWELLGAGALLFNTGLQVVMPWFSINGATITRYSTPVNILTVLIALSVVKLLGEGTLTTIPVRLTWAFLPLVEATATLNVCTSLASSLDRSTGRVALLTLVVVVLAMVVAVFWQFWARVPLVVRFNDRLHRFSSRTPRDQLAVIKRWGRRLGPNLLVFGVAYLIAVISMLLMNEGWRIYIDNATYNTLAYALGQREPLLLMTALIIFSGVKFFQALTKRYWTSLAIVVIFNLIFIVGSRVKIQSRNEPVLPADLSALNVELIKMVDTKTLLLGTIVILILVVLVVLAEKKLPLHLAWSWRRRIGWLLVLPLLLATSFFWNQQGPLNNFLTSLGDQPTFYSQLDGARRNGPTLQFLNNVDSEVMKKPSGYSAATMRQVVRRYQKEAAQINRHRTNKLGDQTVIFNLSESFANPQRVPGVTLTKNPVPYITSLKKKTTGGLMLSSGYGGGTANMEYMTLTGLSLSNFLPTLAVPYTQLVTRLAKEPSVVDSFKHAVAIHPYQGVFYSRIAVYKKFGFDKFLYLGSKYPIKHQHKIDRSPYLSDKTAYANTLDQIKGYSGGQFINLITMQNHLPFDQNYYNNLSQYQAKTVSSGTDKNSLNDYITGIHYTDNYVKQFIKQIDRINKPITVVFYGDHLPGIYGNSMATDGLKLHETDYFIYSNRYARRHGAHSLKANSKIVDPNDFMAMVAKQTNSRVNWYQALLTRVHEQLPAVAVNFNQSSSDQTADRNEFVNQQGKVVKKKNFTKHQKQLWHDYQLLQYDITAGHHYVLKYLK
jgi:phosphoglycerol transferase MdoB-like AlkP superfamily enzyme